MFMTSRARDSVCLMEAVSRSQAVVEFDLDGNVLGANENFCRIMGYTEAEIKGKHHSLFCDKDQVASEEYRAAWAGFRNGTFKSGTFRRLSKDGNVVWIAGSYTPVMRNGRAYKVVKTASDVTAAKAKAVEDAGRLDALFRATAVIEFDPAGTVLFANENLCRALGYSVDEILGKNHADLCDRDYVSSAEYKTFWEKLTNGHFQSGEFVRLGKGGRQVWIQGAYNPILADDGRVVKIMTIAADVTSRMTSIELTGDAIRRLANGDLSRTLDDPFVPSMEGLRIDFNEALVRLRGIVGRIGSSAEIMAVRSEQLGSSSADLLRRAEGQAASLEQTAAALDELTSTVAETSRRATEAGALTHSTRNAAEESGKVVDRAIEAMSRIENSSREIGSISGMIDELAFQTNLLALNAGIEAARAGDAGRGFAVVAQEVRTLAQRSAEAAKNIQALLSTSNTNVKEGSRLVFATGDALKNILERLTEIDANVSAIAGTANEQAIGIREIGVSVHSLDQTTQNNAALADENSAASADMAAQADDLRRLVGTFKLEDGQVRLSRLAA
jgi:PAS domain S-box